MDNATVQGNNSVSGPQFQIMESLFTGLQPAVREILLLAAIPHTIDARVANLIFPASLEGTLKTLRAFRFSNENRQGQIELHVLARRYLLNVWQRRNPARFRKISAQLAEDYQRRMGELRSGSIADASEWLFHALAANPADAIRLVINLFHELVESRELGPAERLMRLVQEQEPWIGEHIHWLDYFNTALAFSHYKNINPRVLEGLIHKHPNTMLAAYSFRLLGQIAVRQKSWAQGRKFLRSALEISKSLGDTYNQALTYLDLGELYQNLVESSGGILTEDREFYNFPHRFFCELARGPLSLYRLAAERIDFLPKFYVMNYQNWIAIHFLRQALRNYRSSEKYFNRLANHRARIELDLRKAKALLTLGHSQSTRRICERALQDQSVQASPYYIASFQSLLGEVYAQQKSFAEAEERFSANLKTYERYEDWDAMGDIAVMLGEIYQKQNKDELALDMYRSALKAAYNSQNLLLQTEIAHYLDTLTQRNGASFPVQQAAERSRRSIKQLAFIDRYPGPVQAIFLRLANVVVYPFMFLFVLALILGAGISMQIIEGEARFNLPSLSGTDVFKLTLAVLLPLLMIWIGQITYFLFAQLIIRTLPLSRVDEAQPNLFVLNEQNIMQKNSQGKIETWLAWKDIEEAIFDHRSLYSTPLAFSSRIDLRSKTRKMLLPASIFRYGDLAKEVKHRLSNHAKAQITQLDFSILQPSWLTGMLILGFIISTYLVLELGIVGCYDNIEIGIEKCPDERKTYIQSLILYGLFFTSLLFATISLVRWRLANHYIKKVSSHGQKEERNQHSGKS